MRAMTVEEIRTLIAHKEAPCLSIYMPTHRGGSPEERATGQRSSSGGGGRHVIGIGTGGGVS